MIKLVIIEDEIQLRETNRILVQNNFPNVEIVGEAGSVQEAIDIINTLKPDIVLLDIELSDGNCFQVLQSCKPISFKPIFITAYNQYAIKAIKFSAIDYLLKPVNEFELCHAMNEAIAHINRETNLEQVNMFEKYYHAPNKEERIVIKTAEAHHIINISDIMYCKSDNSYTSLYIKDRGCIIASKSIKEYDELLSHFDFIRPHQSYLVNLHYVDRIDKMDGGFLILKDKTEVPISKRQKHHIFSKLDSL